MIKISVTSYILSQKSHVFYLYQWSTYGRIAVLSAPHDNIFDLECNSIMRKEMISKGEMIW